MNFKITLCPEGQGFDKVLLSKAGLSRASYVFSSQGVSKALCLDKTCLFLI